jgi:parallel beta-helix repeat protein
VGEWQLKKLIYGILLILVLCSTLVFVDVVEARGKSKTWIVSKDGTGDFTVIQSALDAAKSGDIVKVKAGVYYEDLIIAKTLQLLGADRGTTIIDGSGVSNEPSGSVVLILANNVVVSGFTIKNARSGGSAIWEDGFNFMTISNNIIQYNGDGIRILHSHGNVIKGNIISNNPYTAIGFNWAYGNKVQGNRIENNLIGVGGGFEPCYNNVFSDNTIASNGKGIEVDFSQSKFYHNNIINNGIQVSIYTSTFSIAWNNGYPSGGNYWSDYTGVDNHKGATQSRTGHDGIGDNPYVINALNKDNYPLMKPLALP